jgi:hypothetical protein
VRKIGRVAEKNFCLWGKAGYMDVLLENLKLLLNVRSWLDM